MSKYSDSDIHKFFTVLASYLKENVTQTLRQYSIRTYQNTRFFDSDIHKFCTVLAGYLKDNITPTLRQYSIRTYQNTRNQIFTNFYCTRRLLKRQYNTNFETIFDQNISKYSDSDIHKFFTVLASYLKENVTQTLRQYSIRTYQNTRFFDSDIHKFCTVLAGYLKDNITPTLRQYSIRTYQNTRNQIFTNFYCTRRLLKRQYNTNFETIFDQNISKYLDSDIHKFLLYSQIT